MTNIPYEERIKNRDNNWYYNKCIRQYHFIIKSEGANQRYKEEISRLNKIIEKLKNYNELVYKRYDRKIKDYPIRSIVRHNLEIIEELKEEGKKDE